MKTNKASLVYLMLVVTLATFLLCRTSHATQKGVEIPRGQVVEKLECLGNQPQSYALYLPSNYTPDRKWPILYAFDPAARGKVPVEHFKEAAEKYGWIVVGSNNSRNGPWQPTADAWNAMFRDTRQRFSLDDGRVYATGFSGGARVAVSIATLCHDCLAGVIACGAGFPVGLAPSSSMHFLYFGIVGVDDFNFAEIKELEEPLTKADVTHRVQTFEGRHEWPPASVATAAIEWMELQAMKAGKRARDVALIDAIWQKEINEAKTLEESRRYYEAYQVYLDLAQSFKGLRDTTEMEKKVAILHSSRELKAAIREEREQIDKQRDLERQLRSLIARRERISLQAGGLEETNDRRTTESNPANRNEEGVNSDNRLAALLSDLHKRSKATEDSSARRVARRTLEGLFIGFFEQGLGLLQTQKRYALAAIYLKLATEINPDRPGAFFYLAWAYVANGDRKKSIQALNNSVEKGFADLAAITDNKAFDPVRNEPQYQKIVERLKKK